MQTLVETKVARVSRILLFGRILVVRLASSILLGRICLFFSRILAKFKKISLRGNFGKMCNFFYFSTANALKGNLFIEPGKKIDRKWFPK